MFRRTDCLISWYSAPNVAISHHKGNFSVLEYKTSSYTGNYFWYKSFTIDNVPDWCYFHCKREDDYYIFSVFDNDFNILYKTNG